MIWTLLVTTLISLPSELQAQNEGVTPLETGSAMDYLFQNPVRWSGGRFTRTPDFIERLSMSVGAGVGNVWRYHDDISNSTLAYSSHLRASYRLAPVHSLELGVSYGKVENCNEDLAFELSYLFDVISFASKVENPERWQLYLRGGVETNVTNTAAVSLNGAMRLQYNATPSVGIYLEPEVSLCCYVATPLNCSYSRGDAITSISAGAAFNLGEIRQSYRRRVARASNTAKYEDRAIMAFKSNLLFDAVSALNIEFEVPIKDSWSISAEWIFPWWNNLDYSAIDSKRNTLQVLNGNIEGKYWFGDRSERSLLTGWFMGLYTGGGLYDVEYDGNGYQGEFFIAAGLSAGYAHAINPSGSLRLEYTLGIGYLQTDYHHYQTLYDADGIWHSVGTADGTYRLFGPTRAKVSLVWLLNCKVKKRGGAR